MTHMSSVANEMLTERQDRDNLLNIHGSTIAKPNYFDDERAGRESARSQVMFECRAYGGESLEGDEVTKGLEADLASAKLPREDSSGLVSAQIRQDASARSAIEAKYFQHSKDDQASFFDNDDCDLSRSDQEN